MLKGLLALGLENRLFLVEFPKELTGLRPKRLEFWFVSLSPKLFPVPVKLPKIFVPVELPPKIVF